MAVKRIALATLLAFMAALMAPAASLAAAAPAPTSTITVPVTGSGGGNTFAGTFQLQKFAADNGQVSAVGILSGTVTTAAGVVTSIVKTVSLPVAVAESTCDILHLDLGPLVAQSVGSAD